MYASPNPSWRQRNEVQKGTGTYSAQNPVLYVMKALGAAAILLLSSCASRSSSAAGADSAAELLNERLRAMEKMAFVQLGQAHNSPPEYWIAGKSTVRYTIGADVMIADSFDGKKGHRMWKLPLDKGTVRHKGTLGKVLAASGLAPVGKWTKEALACLDETHPYAVYKFTLGLEGWLVKADGTETQREGFGVRPDGRVQYGITNAERKLFGWK